MHDEQQSICVSVYEILLHFESEQPQGPQLEKLHAIFHV